MKQLLLWTKVCQCRQLRYTRPVNLDTITRGGVVVLEALPLPWQCQGQHLGSVRGFNHVSGPHIRVLLYAVLIFTVE